MKKLGIAAVLLAAGVVAVSGVFAQEIKFDGYVNTGLGVVFSTEEGARDPFLAATASDAQTAVYRVQLNGSYTTEDGNAGANLRVRAQGSNADTFVNYFYGWVSAFDKILTVKGGLVDDGTWNTAGYVLGGDQGEGLGALAKLSPISGLDIGAGAYLSSAPGSAAATLSEGVDLDVAKYTFNLSYTLPDLVKIVATYRPKSGGVFHTTSGYVLNDQGIPVLKETLVTDVAKGTSRALLGVDLKAVPNLKAVLELELDNLQDFKALKAGEKDAWDQTVSSPTDSSGKINIYETVQYDLGSLSVGLFAIEWLSQAKETDFAFYVNPWVSYALGSIVPRLDIGYGGAARADFNNGELQWHRQNYTPVYNNDISVISIRPSVKFNINSKTYIELGDLIDIDGYKNNPDWGGDNSRISNVFYVDFKWAF